MRRQIASSAATTTRCQDRRSSEIQSYTLQNHLPLPPHSQSSLIGTTCPRFLKDVRYTLQNHLHLVPPCSKCLSLGKMRAIPQETSATLCKVLFLPPSTQCSKLSAMLKFLFFGQAANDSSRDVGYTLQNHLPPPVPPMFKVDSSRDVGHTWQNHLHPPAPPMFKVEIQQVVSQTLPLPLAVEYLIPVSAKKKPLPLAAENCSPPSPPIFKVEVVPRVRAASCEKKATPRKLCNDDAAQL